MTASSTIDLTGTLTLTTTRKTDPVTITQTIDLIEAKDFELTIPHAGALATIALCLSPGVTEALFVHLYCPKNLLLKLTSSDTTTPGPMSVGLRGHWMMTLYPGEGITQIQVQNPDQANDVTLQVAIGALGQLGDTLGQFFQVP
jgi:hypothetical protein